MEIFGGELGEKNIIALVIDQQESREILQQTTMNLFYEFTNSLIQLYCNSKIC